MVRHGQSEANVGLSTDADCGLTALGFEQAAADAKRLREFDLEGFVVLVSPYCRAVRTAEVIALETGARFEVEPELREWGPAATVGGATYAQEPVVETVARLRAFLRRQQGRRLLIVSHAAPIALLTQLAWGEPPLTDGAFWAGVGNCCPRWLKVTATAQGAG